MKDSNTSEFVSKFHHSDKLIYHGRFRDDNLILFYGCLDKIQDFCHRELLSQIPGIYSITSYTNVSVLDITVYTGTIFSNSQRLNIRSNTISTISFQYVRRQSDHSPSVFKDSIN